MKFSETLKNKRHELGLTISQASSVLKLKESVLIAFEEGDFENMPKSGYAQGMLASYARYLGLSPRELVDMYSEEYYEYIHGSSSHDLRRRSRDTRAGRIIDGYDVPNESESRPKAYVELRPYLPTAGGPMGDYGAFATTSGVHSRSTGAEVTPTTLVSGPTQYSSIYTQPEYAERSPYNSTYSLDRSSRGARRRNDGDAQRSRSRNLRRDDIQTRSVPSDQYDDRSLDNGAVPFESASSEEGRRSSHNIARVERPNIDRSRQRRNSSSSRNRGRSSGGVGSGLMRWFGDARRALFTVIVLLGLMLTGITIFSIKTCAANNRNEPEQTRTVGVTPAQSTDTSQDDGSEGEQTASAGANEQVPITITKPAEPTVVMVKVTVADGQVSWLEITADGESSIADTITGPWEQTYDVKTQLVVRASDISAVSVFVNGEQRQFEMKSSGVGIITVDGPPQPEVEKNESGEDGGDSGTPEAGSTNSDGDEYVTTYNGYDIYQDKNGVMYFTDEETGIKYNAADGTLYSG